MVFKPWHGKFSIEEATIILATFDRYLFTVDMKIPLLAENSFISFDDRKECLIRLPFAVANDKFLKSFVNKLEIFTNYRVKFYIV